MNRTDDGAVFCCESFYMLALTSIETFTFAFYNNIEEKLTGGIIWTHYLQIYR